MEGLIIRLSDKKEFGYPTIDKHLQRESSKVYEVESLSEKFYVAASFIKIYENELNFDTTSLTFDESAKGKLIWTDA